MMAQNLLNNILNGGKMDRNVILISNDPSFIFVITTIIDQFELNLFSIEKKDSIWKEINEKKPRIVIWDFSELTGIEKVNEKIHNYVSHDCHLLLFSNAISGLSHLKDGSLHLFEKPFSPNEISHLIKEITS